MAQLDAGLAQAAAQGKPLLVQVGANWRPDARRLEAFNRAEPAILSDIQSRFVLIRINKPRDVIDASLQSRLPEFDWIPTLIACSADGSVRAVAEGRSFDTEKGCDREALVAFLQRTSKS